MLVEESFDRVLFRDVVEAIFATDKRDEAEAVIEEFSKFWMSIIGTRGATGKKTVNASTQFANLFEEVK
jgi:truncated hemoglobin YjbI